MRWCVSGTMNIRPYAKPYHSSALSVSLVVITPRFATADATRGRAITGLPENAGRTIVLCAVGCTKRSAYLGSGLEHVAPSLGCAGRACGSGAGWSRNDQSYRRKLEAAIDHDLPGTVYSLVGFRPLMWQTYWPVPTWPCCRAGEPFGLSVVEAWATSLPLVASRVGGPAPGW